MTLPKQLAKQLRDVHVGGNWTAVNLKDSLADVSWQQAITKVDGLHTIAVLVFHINYYMSPVLKVLRGEPLVASDKFSFDLPAVNCDEDWQQLKDKAFREAALLANEIEQMDEAIIFHDFAGGQYGNYCRNLLGIIEHTHYHLGQISIIKKLIIEKNVG